LILVGAWKLLKLAIIAARTALFLFTVVEGIAAVLAAPLKLWLY